MPVLTVVAGANGAGKSTLTKLYGVNALLIDPDAIAREINPVNPAADSTNAGHQLIATVEGDRSIIYAQELPGWIDRANLNLRSRSV